MRASRSFCPRSLVRLTTLSSSATSSTSSATPSRWKQWSDRVPPPPLRPSISRQETYFYIARKSIDRHTHHVVLGAMRCASRTAHYRAGFLCFGWPLGFAASRRREGWAIPKVAARGAVLCNLHFQDQIVAGLPIFGLQLWSYHVLPWIMVPQVMCGEFELGVRLGGWVGAMLHRCLEATCLCFPRRSEHVTRSHDVPIMSPSLIRVVAACVIFVRVPSLLRCCLARTRRSSVHVWIRRERQRPEPLLSSPLRQPSKVPERRSV